MNTDFVTQRGLCNRLPIVHAMPMADVLDMDAPPPFPIWVIPVSKMLTFDKLQTHEELQAQGALVQWTKGMGDILFVSHTWLKYHFPDGDSNEKLTLLKDLLNAIRAGKLSILPNWSTQFVVGRKYWIKAADLTASLSNGFVWFDVCIRASNRCGLMPSHP